MSSFSNSRKKLGFSQQELADYLGVSRSLIAKVEQGLRELPTQALIDFSRLKRTYSLASLGEKSFTLSDTTKSQVIEELNNHLEKLALKIIQKQKKLSEIETNYTDALLQVRVFEEELQQLSIQDRRGEGQKIILEMVLNRAYRTIQSNSLAVQMILAVELEALQLEEERLAEKLNFFFDEEKK